jgi:hypothetical protein
VPECQGRAASWAIWAVFVGNFMWAVDYHAAVPARGLRNSLLGVGIACRLGKRLQLNSLRFK